MAKCIFIYEDQDLSRYESLTIDELNILPTIGMEVSIKQYKGVVTNISFQVNEVYQGGPRPNECKIYIIVEPLKYKV